MSKIIHHTARQQTQIFLEILWNDLPTGWQDNYELNKFEFELFLAGFDSYCQDHKLKGFALIAEARKRAERRYQRDFKQVHHTPMDWAFFRFRLELALLKTAGASQWLLDIFYAQHDVIAGFALRIGPYGQDRPLKLNQS